MANGTSVTDLKQKPDRTRHVRKLLGDDVYEIPDSDQENGQADQDDQKDGADDTSGGSSATGGATDTDEETGKKERRQTAAHPFSGIKTKTLHPRIQRLVDETVKLNADKFPNSVAVLLRAIIELTVTEYLDRKGNTPGKDMKLTTRIREAMKLLSIPNKDPEFQPLRTKLNEKYSIISVPNLHQYVHNPNAMPGKSDLDSIAIAYRPLLVRICSDLD